MTTEAPARIYKAAAPTVAFNAPVPQMDIPEKSFVVGALTGKVHAVIGDNPAGPETVTVTPPGGMPRRARIGMAAAAGATPTVEPPSGAVSMAGGGEMEVGPGGRTRAQVTGTDYLSDAERAWFLGQSTNIDANAQQFLNAYNNPQQPQQPQATAGAAMATPPPYDPLEAQRAAQQAAIDARGGVATAQQGQITANAGVLNAQANQLPYKQAVFDAQGRQIDAQGNVLTAQSNVIPLKSQQIDAQGNVITAQGTQTAAQRAAIQQTQQANVARMAEQQGIQAAASNVADKTAVAQAQNTRANEDYKYALAGLNTPTEIDTANGADANLPAGVRARLQTQEQLKTTAASNNEKLRSIQLDQAQQIVNLAATDVAAANQAAARVGLSVDKAQLLVEEARIAEGRAGLDVSTASNNANKAGLAVDAAQIASGRAGNAVDQANLALYNAATSVQQAQQPPAGVPAGYQVVIDPFTGQSQYMSAADAAIKTNQDKMKLAAAMNSETPLAAFSDSQVIGMLTNSFANPQVGPPNSAGFINGQVSEEMVRADLIRRGYTPQQAQALIDQARLAAQAKVKEVDPVAAAIAAALAGSGLGGP